MEVHMSLSVTAQRNTLIAEARTEWQSRAQTKAQVQGTKVPSTPTDTVLIQQDSQLAAELKKLEEATEALATAAVASAQSGSIVNVVG
jgi:hypothetical protein